jgi:hypothetical protein
MTATYFGFLITAIFRLWLCGFLYVCMYVYIYIYIYIIRSVFKYDLYFYPDIVWEFSYLKTL